MFNLYPVCKYCKMRFSSLQGGRGGLGRGVTCGMRNANREFGDPLYSYKRIIIIEYITTSHVTSTWSSRDDTNYPMNTEMVMTPYCIKFCI